MTKRTPGRPTSFDYDDVVERAIAVFWRNAGPSTPLDVLEAELDIRRSTLYNSFGGRDGLHELASHRYQDQLTERALKPLHDGTRGCDDLLEFFTQLGEALVDPNTPQGCLILNTLGGPNVDPLAESHLAHIHEALAVTLQRAVNAGELNRDDTEWLASALLAQVIGITHGANSDSVDIEKLVSASKQLVTRERRDRPLA